MVSKQPIRDLGFCEIGGFRVPVDGWRWWRCDGVQAEADLFKMRVWVG